MATSRPSLATEIPNSLTGPHVHIGTEICPLCEQPIPHDRAEEVAQKREALERQREAELTDRLASRFELEKAEALAKAAEEAGERIAAARESARVEAEIEAKAALASADAAKQAAEAD